MISAQEALKKLKAGNLSFVEDISQDRQVDSVKARRLEVVDGQKPFAIILACSDSRVPVEMVFDQGIGDLFPIRVAGNIATPSQIGSIEFAATQFGSPLVVVMGHSQCGAIKATVQQLQQPGDPGSPNLASIVDCIRPGIEHLSLDQDFGKLVAAGVRANVSATLKNIIDGSDIIAKMVAGGELSLVGAEYSLETGVVDFFDEV